MRITSRAQVEKMLSEGWLLLVHDAGPQNDFQHFDLIRDGETTSPWRNAVSSLMKANVLELDHTDVLGSYYRLRKPAK